MDAASALSRGAIEVIMNKFDEAYDLFPQPVLQCITVKAGNPTPQGIPRYRVTLSDGQYALSALLATQTHHLIAEGKLVANCIVRLEQYTKQVAGGKAITVIFGLEVLEQYGVPARIGQPTQVPPKAEADTANTAISNNDFYGAKKEETKPQQQVLRSVPSAPQRANLYPIEGLSMYAHTWTIKARVTYKSDIKTWHKPTGEGKLFSVNFLDESGEIRATGFNDQCDAFYDLLQEGSVYYVSTPCKVSPAKKQFSNLSNDYELTFQQGTVIEKAEDQTNVPQVRFNFCSLEELQNIEKDSVVDVIGVLKEMGEVNEFASKKDGRPFQKRDLTIVDDTGHSVRVTVWGKTANSFDTPPETVIAFKGTKVSDFNGKSLSLLSSGTMSVDPDISDAHKLKGWYDSAGRSSTFESLQNKTGMGGATGRKEDIKTLQQVVDENVGHDQEAYYTVKATVALTKQENFCYPGCPKCRKKVVEIGDGTWRCEKCDESLERPEYRYMLSVKVLDHTGRQWQSCFDETATQLLGMSANQLMEIDDEDKTRSRQILQELNFKTFWWTCRARLSTFGETMEVRHQVVRVSPLDYKSEGLKLAEKIKQLSM
ncbi:replication factor-a protein 1 [Stachybotrys elegans]|uniref:Replication protein A subunit n=1 Tax=Stachybotrys elegans TaxID=80388 RepID=A0A8K0T022_9HYPO|nr:replication factor-a protein 1 [Stachybotrys elegans]